MEGLEREAAPYAERKLTELLDFACDQLYPTEGYRLELDGIKPDTLILKELEATSGYVLDAKKGARFEFTFDEASDQLVLDSFRQPLKNQPSLNLAVQKTESNHDELRYISFLETVDETIPDPINPTRLPIQPEFLEAILAGYGIHTPPHPNHDSYTLWRAELMSKCQTGWKVSEYANLLTDLTAHNTETIELSNTQSYASDGGVSIVKTLSKNFDAIDGTGEFAQRYSSTVVSIENSFGKSLRLQNEVGNIKFDPFIINDPGKLTWSERNTLEIDVDSFNDFQRLIQDSTHYIQERHSL